MFILSPQYLLFEGLFLFLVSLLVFRFLLGTNAGRSFVRRIWTVRTPDTIAADFQRVQGEAQSALPVAAAGLEQKRQVVNTLRKAAGEPQQDGAATE